MRGALNKIGSLTTDEKARGVVACSAGNHAQGVARSAAQANVKCEIVMPVNAPIVKVEATKSYGAQIHLHGDFFDEAYEKAREIALQKSLVFVPAYEDPFIIAGQGTIGLEILEETQPDQVIVPIGGGGLISGIAIAIKSRLPSCKIIGVQSDQADNILRIFKGLPLQDQQKRIATIADGIAIKRHSQVMLDSFLKTYVDEIVSVSDDQIAEAIVLLLERNRTVAEGAGAAGLAALLAGKVKPAGKTVVVISGGNIDLNLMELIIRRGLVRRGRLAELSVVVDDLPGNLSRLTQILASHRANVLDVSHDRIGSRLSLRQTRITFLIETVDLDHIRMIRESFVAAGATFVEVESEQK